MYHSLCAEFGEKNTSLHISWIQCIEPEDKKKYPNFLITDLDVEKVMLIIAAADLVLSNINKDDLLAFYGIKFDQRPEASKLKM